MASNIKAQVSCAVMSVGGFRSFDIAQKAVNEAGMDYISFSRPLIREPDLADRWQRCDTQPAICISCNKCFVPGVKEGGIYCMVEKKRAAAQAPNLTPIGNAAGGSIRVTANRIEILLLWQEFILNGRIPGPQGQVRDRRFNPRK